MAGKQCGLGFSCAAMMQQSDLRVKDCPNRSVCRSAQRLATVSDRTEVLIQNLLLLF